MKPERKNFVLGASAVSLAAVLWGFDGIVLTPRLYNLEVSYVVFILHLFPFLLMNFVLYREYRHLRNFTASDFTIFLLIALFGGAFGTLAIVKALFLLNFNHLSIVVLLQKLQPIFAILLAVIFLGEKTGKNFLVWAGLAMIGGYFLTFGLALPDFETGGNTLKASLLALVAAFSFGSSTVFSKMILGKYSFVTSAFYRYGFTSLIMLIIMLGFGDFGQFAVTTKINWLFIAIICLTTGTGTIFLYYYGLRQVKAIMATISELMFPVSAVIFDYIFNGSLFTPVQWISAAVMIFAIIKLNMKPGKAANH
ncbi:MAG: DMT family transporter [Bacteroidales bacterium]|nr:DMT family transporter [Bacteroidales bacterium]